MANTEIDFDAAHTSILAVRDKNNSLEEIIEKTNVGSNLKNTKHITCLNHVSLKYQKELPTLKKTQRMVQDVEKAVYEMICEHIEMDKQIGATINNIKIW